MSQKHKIVRTKTLYKKRVFPKKTLGRIIFVVLIAILVCIGYIVMREWNERFGKDADKNFSSTPLSSIVSSSEPQSSSAPVSSEPVKLETGIAKAAFINAQDILLLGGNISDKLSAFKAEGYSTVAVEFKAIDGMLSYKSTNEMALKYKAVSENAVDIATLYKAITDAGLTPVAEISTLKDALAPHVQNQNSYAYMTVDGPNWLDNSFDRGGKPWLNPYMDNARKYICDIAKEISDAGFETILLSNVMFPDKNTTKLNTIKTEPSRDQILNQLVREVETAVGESVSVIREINVSNLATGENVYGAEIFKVSAKSILLNLDLAAIESNKAKICVRNGIVTETGVAPAITAAEVANSLIEIAKNNFEGNVGIGISKSDMELLKQAPNYKDDKVENYIIK